MSQSASSLSWGFLLLPVIAIVLLGMPAATLWLVLRHKRRDPREGGSCGKCGYTVRGIATLTCPECGADLREVGIRSGSPGGNVFIGAGLLWLIFVSVMGFAVFVVVMRSGPINYSYRRVLMLQAPTWRDIVQADSAPQGQFVLTMQGAPNLSPMFVDAAGQCRIGPGGAWRTFDGSAVLDWLVQASVNPGDAGDIATGDDVVFVIQEMQRNTSAGFTQRPNVTGHPVTTWSSMQRVLSHRPVLVIVCVLAFGLAGVLWIASKLRPPRWQMVTVTALWLIVLGAFGLLVMS